MFNVAQYCDERVNTESGAVRAWYFCLQDCTRPLPTVRDGRAVEAVEAQVRGHRRVKAVVVLRLLHDTLSRVLWRARR
eukprot:11182349-Lingulodinium_polyedra.AAC.1